MTGAGWRPIRGKIIRICFNEPQRLCHIHLVFEEEKYQMDMNESPGNMKSKSTSPQDEKNNCDK